MKYSKIILLSLAALCSVNSIPVDIEKRVSKLKLI